MFDGGEDGGAEEEVEEVGEDEEDHPPSRPHPGIIHSVDMADIDIDC